MATLLVHPDLPMGIDGSRILKRRGGLTVARPRDAAAFCDRIRDADALLLANGHWTDEYAAGLDVGDWVQSMSAGNDRIPSVELAERGVRVAGADVHGPTVAEHALAMATAFTRDLLVFREKQRAREWHRDHAPLTDLAAATVAVLGLGTIGGEVVERARAFGATVHGVKRDPRAYEGPLPPERVHGPGDWRSVLPAADLLVLAVPLTDETEGLVGAGELGALPGDAVVVNVARGPVLDQDALLAALDRDELGGAALDVLAEEPPPPDSPLWEREDVLLTPHAATHSERFPDRLADLVLENYDRWRAGDPLRNELG
jgi:phosphoglycerate dehydrogenase-like enzyme